MELLLDYILRILPGVLLVMAFLLLLPRKNLQCRILAYFFLFILVRDAMTPLQLWRFGREGLFWIRFTDDGAVLFVIAILSGCITAAMYYYEKELRKLLVWSKIGLKKTILAGLAGGVVTIIPLVTPYIQTPKTIRGGIVDLELLIPIFLMAMLGNFYEEVVFRGYFQGYLEKIVDQERAFLLSGVIFSIAHIYLAYTVTYLGISLVLYTLFEGLVAAFVRMKAGLVGAVISHGLAIFILASGLF